MGLIFELVPEPKTPSDECHTSYHVQYQIRYLNITTGCANKTKLNQRHYYQKCVKKYYIHSGGWGEVEGG